LTLSLAILAVLAFVIIGNALYMIKRVLFLFMPLFNNSKLEYISLKFICQTVS
jgi:hypothetical protein